MILMRSERHLNNSETIWKSSVLKGLKQPPQGKTASEEAVEIITVRIQSKIASKK